MCVRVVSPDVAWWGYETVCASQFYCFPNSPAGRATYMSTSSGPAMMKFVCGTMRRKYADWIVQNGVRNPPAKSISRTTTSG